MGDPKAWGYAALFLGAAFLFLLSTYLITLLPPP